MVKQIIVGGAGDIPTKVASDKAHQNAMKLSDKQNVSIEHDKVLQSISVDLLTDHPELFKQFSDNAAFKKWLTDTIFSVTCKPPSLEEHGIGSDLQQQETRST